MYADDTQPYKAVAPQNITSGISAIESCCSSVQSWMETHKLKLNNEKTEVLICGTQAKLKSIQVPHIRLEEDIIHISHSAKHIGVVLDRYLNMDIHISNMVKVMSFALRQIGKMKPYLPNHSLKTIVSSLVLSRLDYCNSLLAGLPVKSGPKFAATE